MCYFRKCHNTEPEIKPAMENSKNERIKVFGRLTKQGI